MNRGFCLLVETDRLSFRQFERLKYKQKQPSTAVDGQRDYSQKFCQKLTTVNRSTQVLHRSLEEPRELHSCSELRYTAGTAKETSGELKNRR